MGLLNALFYIPDTISTLAHTRLKFNVLKILKFAMYQKKKAGPIKSGPALCSPSSWHAVSYSWQHFNSYSLEFKVSWFFGNYTISKAN